MIKQIKNIVKMRALNRKIDELLRIETASIVDILRLRAQERGTLGSKQPEIMAKLKELRRVNEQISDCVEQVQHLHLNSSVHYCYEFKIVQDW